LKALAESLLVRGIIMIISEIEGNEVMKDEVVQKIEKEDENIPPEKRSPANTSSSTALLLLQLEGFIHKPNRYLSSIKVSMSRIIRSP